MTETPAISEAAKKAAYNLGFSRRGGVAKRIQRAIDEATERLAKENRAMRAALDAIYHKHSGPHTHGLYPPTTKICRQALFGEQGKH